MRSTIAIILLMLCMSIHTQALTPITPAASTSSNAPDTKSYAAGYYPSTAPDTKSYAAGYYASNAPDTIAEEVKEMVFYTEVKDHITHKAVTDSIEADLMTADSIYLDTISVRKWSWGDETMTMLVGKIKRPGKYLIRVEAPGYEVKYMPFEVEKFYKRERNIDIKTIYLHKAPKRMEHTLNEVVVKATKLKFYMDGDTLVYNADAFEMAEGSMLDALIRKLPGVELKTGGEITVNGKKVDALLLNGKDFFDQDRELILDNMPSFMVKNIQTYDREKKSLRGTRQAKLAQKELVMNVRLKRDYNEGWLSTIEGGAGTNLHHAGGDSPFRTQTPFLGRVFATRFDNRSRLVLFANANNLSDTRNPGEKGDWSPLTQATGLTTIYKAGGNYKIQKDDAYEYEGSAQGTYTDTDNRSYSNSETFLAGGNTWGRDWSRDRSYTWDFRSNHKLDYQPHWKPFKRSYLSLSPSLQLNKWHNNATSATATFHEDVANQLGKAWLDSIMAPNAGQLLQQYAINRTLTSSKANGNSQDANINASSYLTPAHNDFIMLGLTGRYNYNNRTEDAFDHYQLDYLRAHDPSDLRNRYTPTLSRNHKASLSAFSYFMLDEKNRNSVSLAMDYDYSYDKSNRSLYLLNKIAEWQSPDSHPLGQLPSYDEMLLTQDHDNSKYSTQRSHTYTPQIRYDLSFGTDTTAIHQLNFNLTLPVRHESLRYQQGQQADTLFSRTTAFLQPVLYYFHYKHGSNRWAMAQYSFTTSAPGMTSLLNIHDTSNPLAVTLSNPNLRNTQTHSLSGQFRDKFGHVLLHTNANASFITNALASSRLYDMQTGVTTTRPENVNGNWNLSSTAGIDFPLAKEKIRVGEEVSYSYNHSVDLNGTSISTGITRSIVCSNNLNNKFTLTYQPTSKYEFGLKSDVHHQRSTSTRANFTTINVTDFDYGLTAKFELPWELQFSTDLTMYSRRGYNDATMNTNELVWNARIAKRALHGNLNFILDGFDLLGKLSNVRRSINAQGRTESYYNVMPSYGLLHVVYRLNKMPKK